MDKDVALAFSKIDTSINALSVQVGRLEQRNVNGDREEDKKHKTSMRVIAFWRVAVALAVGVIAVMQFVNN